MKLLIVCVFLTACGSLAKVEGDALDRVDERIQNQQDAANEAVAKKRAEFAAELDHILQQLPDLQEKLISDLKAKYCPDSQLPACATFSNL